MSRQPEKREKPRQSKDERPIREDLVLQACLEAYGAIRHEGRLADRALEFVLRTKRNLGSKERRTVAERVYALLRRQLTVDHLLGQAAPGFDKLVGARKDRLRLCAARVLLGEDEVQVGSSAGLTGPDAAALEALPAAAASLEQLPREERFGLAASLPPHLALRFLREFGPTAEAEAEAMNERAPLTGRVNTLKCDREALVAALRAVGVKTEPTRFSPLGVLMETRINAFSLEPFREGLFELQDEGSQLLGLLVDAPPTKVVDACAGAGGKTLQLAAQMKNRGELFALDIDERRMEDLRRRSRRAGVHNVRVRVVPSGPEAVAALADLHGKADRVLVDAPCSGSGTYRRKPDARYRLTEADLLAHAARQAELLERFSVLVKPGGRLVYGTCSVFREENEDVVQAFLGRHKEFAVRPAELELGPDLGGGLTRDGFLRTSPSRHGTDGFFGAILVRAKTP